MTFGEFVGALSNSSLRVSIYDSYDRSTGEYRGYICSTVKGSHINNLFKDKEVEYFDTAGFAEITVALKMGEK